MITIDCCLKHSILKGRFQTKYISPSQVLIKDITGEQGVTIHSSKALPINEIKVTFFVFLFFPIILHNNNSFKLLLVIINYYHCYDNELL